MDDAGTDRTVGTPAPPTAPRPRAVAPAAPAPTRRVGIGVGAAVLLGAGLLGLLGVGALAALGVGAWALRGGDASDVAAADAAGAATAPAGEAGAAGAPADGVAAGASVGGETAEAVPPRAGSAPGARPSSDAAAPTLTSTGSASPPPDDVAPTAADDGAGAGTPVSLAGGLSVRAPAGWQSQVVDATRAAFVAPDGKTMVVVALDDARGADVRAELSAAIDLDDGVVLDPAGTPRAEAGGYANDFAVRGAPDARSVVMAKTLDDGRVFATIGIAAGGGFDAMRAAQRAVHASARFGRSAAASAGAGSWAAYLKGRYLVRIYNGNGYGEKHEIWLCSNGNYVYAMDGGGFTAGVASGAFSSGAEGAWSASGSTGGTGTVTLVATDGTRTQRSVRMGSDGVYVDGERWMRGDNTRCP